MFKDGAEYAHGGVSPQESIVPELQVMPLGAARQVTIERAEWDGMRLRIRAKGGAGLTADLRAGVDGEGRSIIVQPRPLEADGQTSLLVTDDRLEGHPARLELRDGDERVVATQTTIVGG